MSGVSKLLERNCSTIFLLNPLGLEKQRLDKLGFVEAYLKDEYSTNEYINPVFLLFKPENVNNFQVFVEREYDRINIHTGTKDLVADYDRGNGEIVLVYEFPFKKDYERFLEGKYSRFSKDIVETYPKTIKTGTDNKFTALGVPYRIITKDRESKEILAQIYGNSFLTNQPITTISDMLEKEFGTPITEDMELWSIPSIEKETLKY